MAINKVLVVDDSKTETMYLTDILAKSGYVVCSAENAEQALLSLESNQPDLILMDVVLPGKNGFQLTRTVSRTPEYSHIPIIICSSKSLETDRIWGLRQGAVDYLTKPVSPELLLTRIKSLGGR
ncbi:MAG: response regulator [Betaproteobacteria bacterium]